MFRRKKVLIYAPFPPPHAGPEVVSEILFRDFFGNPDYRIFKSNIRKENAGKGELNFSGIAIVFQKLIRLFFVLLKDRPRKFYFLLSSSKVGFSRDVILILMARLFLAAPVAHYHGANFGHFYQYSSPKFQRLIRWAMAKVQIVLVLGEALKSDFQKLCPNRVVVLPNPVDPKLFSQSLRISKKKTPDDKTVLLFLGHLSFTKGLYDLMVVVDRLIEKKSNIELLISGDFILNPETQIEFLSGETREFYRENVEKIQKKIATLLGKTSPAIRYLGFITGMEKYELYSKSDIFVLPSYTEGFPMSLLEAFSFGLPAVVSRVGAMPEFLHDNENVLFVTPGDQRALEEKLLYLIENKEHRQKMGRENQAMVSMVFALEPIQKRLSEIFSQ